jgi:hypothetical protein
MAEKAPGVGQGKVFEKMLCKDERAALEGDVFRDVLDNVNDWIRSGVDIDPAWERFVATSDVEFFPGRHWPHLTLSSAVYVACQRSWPQGLSFRSASWYHRLGKLAICPDASRTLFCRSVVAELLAESPGLEVLR